jgi:hypothetical protein
MRHLIFETSRNKKEIWTGFELTGRNQRANFINHPNMITQICLCLKSMMCRPKIERLDLRLDPDPHDADARRMRNQAQRDRDLVRRGDQTVGGPRPSGVKEVMPHASNVPCDAGIPVGDAFWRLSGTGHEYDRSPTFLVYYIPSVGGGVRLRLAPN